MNKYSYENAKEIDSQRCGRLLEIFNIKGELNVSAIIIDSVGQTVGHYHTNTDELYFCLDGSITITLYDPKSNTYENVLLAKYDSLLIKKNIHHKINHAENATLLAVCLSGWDINHEFDSDVIF